MAKEAEVQAKLDDYLARQAESENEEDHAKFQKFISMYEKNL